MKNRIFTALLLCFLSISAYAKSSPADSVAVQSIPEGYELVDSVVYRPVSAVDTTLAGKKIWAIMPSRANGDSMNVSISKPEYIKAALDSQIVANPARSISGYRIRVYFDNSQSSRTDSEAILRRFETAYPGVPVYRTYANPYFKVTAGDFRTRSEAMALLVRLKDEFPRALLVKERINYPAADSKCTYIKDTVKVLRPIVQIQNL